MKMHLLIRFGKWQEILEEPMPDDPDLNLHATAMRHYARAIADAVLGEVDEADEERALFRAAAVPGILHSLDQSPLYTPP